MTPLTGHSGHHEVQECGHSNPDILKRHNNNHDIPVCTIIVLTSTNVVKIILTFMNTTKIIFTAIKVSIIILTSKNATIIILRESGSTAVVL
jgi:hypothetical protein